MDRKAFLARMEAWLAANPLAFAHRVDGDTLTLVERATEKVRVLSGDEVVEVHEKTNRLTGVAYPILLLENGLQLAVTDIGFCFAPAFAATGTLIGVPEVGSLGDFEKLHREARFAAEDPTRRKDALDLMMLCIAIVDGARAVGLDVGREEERLERLLRQIEGGGTA